MGKKNRAKQRTGAGATSHHSSGVGSSACSANIAALVDKPLRKILCRQSATSIVKSVRQCDNVITLAAVNFRIMDASIQKSLLKAGLVSTVLDLLKCCGDKSFADMLKESKGNLAHPYTWINFLDTASACEMNDLHLQIAENIGPLVR